MTMLIREFKCECGRIIRDIIRYSSGVIVGRTKDFDVDIKVRPRKKVRK